MSIHIRVLLLSALVAATSLGCGDDGGSTQFSWRIVVADGTLSEPAVRIARIRRGTCDGAIIYENATSDTVVDWPAPTLADGMYAFQAEVRDSECNVIARGCTSAAVPFTSDLVVTAAAAGALQAVCNAPTCVQGFCSGEPTDEGTRDAGADADSGSDEDAGRDTGDPEDASDGACSDDEDCVFANASGVCLGDGTCDFNCEGTFADCDGASENGCETNLQSEERHCGNCDVVCSLPNADPVCTEAECRVLTCEPTFGNCNGMADDGCEQPLDTDEHCGECGRTCPWGGCEDGACEVPVDITVGGDHSCAVLGGGRAICWGAGANGQLGNGARTASAVPEVVVMLEDFVEVSAGTSHTCGRRRTNAVACWGDNAAQQLGRTDVVDRESPLQPLFPLVALRIEAGGNFNCAQTDASTLRCWGADDRGQLGGEAVPGEIYTDVAFMRPIQDYSLGDTHACAVLTDSTVHCWGGNGKGQVGDLTTVDQPTPVQVMGLSGVSKVVARGEHSCALLAGGNVQCWGENADRQLGNGTSIDSASPSAVLSISEATEITAGVDATCALQRGSVLCWGRNAESQLGRGMISMTASAGAVSGIMGTVTHIASRRRHSCAITEDGTMYCWGGNTSGQLGDPAPQLEAVAVTIPMLE